MILNVEAVLAADAVAADLPRMKEIRKRIAARIETVTGIVKEIETETRETGERLIDLLKKPFSAW